MKPSRTDLTPSRRVPRAPSGADEVAGLHRARDVDGEHDVAGGLGALDGRADPFGAGEGEDDERPEQPRRRPSAPASAAGRRRPRPCRGRRSSPRRTGCGRPAPSRGAAGASQSTRSGSGRAASAQGKASSSMVAARSSGAPRRGRRAPSKAAARAVGRGGEGRGRAGRRRRRCGRGRRSRPSPVSVRHLGARGGDEGDAAEQRSGGGRARRGRRPRAPGARVRSSARAARRQAVARRWRSQAQRPKARRRGGARRGPPRPRSAGIIETGGGSTMSWSWSRRSTRLSAGGLRFHQALRRGGAPKRRRSCGHGRLAGADREDRGVEAFLPGEQPLRAARRRRLARLRAHTGVGEVELDLQAAVADDDAALLGISWAEGSWTRARTRSLPRAMPVRMRQRRLVGAVEVARRRGAASRG